MRENAASNEVVLFAHFPPHGFIHGWLMPHEGLDINEALKARVRPSDAWSVEEDLNAEELYIDPPLSTLMAGCEQFLYRRNFLGSGKGDYTEISQKLVHVMGLHLSEGQRWCRFDENCDIEDVIFVQDDIDIEESFRASVVIMRAKDLHEYMALTRCALVQHFSFSRFDREGPIVWDDAVRQKASERDLSYETGVVERVASYAKGVQIIRPSVKAGRQLAAKLRQSLFGEDREYETFIAVDFATNRRIEASCSPHNLSYPCKMVPDLPSAYSAAFFRSEVIGKYKNNPDKYDLSYDSISCRGAWSLRSFGRNDAGQIHVYLKDLGDLCVNEQRYWKTFNVQPDAGISRKSIKRDFLGDWDEEYDALEAIKQKVAELNERKPDWWLTRDERLIQQAQYPMTESAKELGDEILNLSKLLVEGFLESALRKIAGGLNRTCDKQLKSLGLLCECLQGLGVSDDEAWNIVKPLKTLNTLRAKIAAHSSAAERERILAEALQQASSFHNYFGEVARQCDESMSRIMETMPVPASCQAG
jgi:hypothetical protein